MNSRFSIPKFLIIFVVLSAGFYGYVGLITPGGKTFSPFLAELPDVTTWFTSFIAKSAKFLLEISGYNVYQKSPSNVTIQGSRGVTILWACLGFGVMSFWTAFVAAHKNPIKYTLKWIAGGVAALIAINIIRIMLIALAFHHNWAMISSFDAHSSFNIAAYVLIFLLMFLFIRDNNKRNSNGETKEDDHISSSRFSTFTGSLFGTHRANK